MKIRSVALNQFKKFTSPMCLNNIGDGLNVFVGPNEMGKSTMLDALRAALFEKYSSKAQAITALQNDRNRAAPVVEVSFEMDAGVYRIKKRFVKKPYAQLFCPDGRKLEGDAAEEELRDLLGFDEPGKTGAKPENLGMWNVLWVQQGQSFGALDVPDSARSNLHSALESEVGAVLGGKRGRALPDAIEKQLSELVTSTARPRGDYKALIEEAETLREEIEDLRNRRKELSQILEDLEAAQETLVRLSSSDRDQTDKGELEDARKRLDQLAKLQSRIEGAITAVELKRRDLAQAKQSLAERHLLKDSIESEQKAVERAERSLNEVRQQDKDLRSTLDKLRKVVRETETAVGEADNSASHTRRILGAIQRDSRIRELNSRLEKSYKAEKRQRTAQKGAAAILVTEKNIEKIQQSAKDLENSGSRLSAAATLVTFDMPADRLSGIAVNDAALFADQTSVQVIEATMIDIPDYGNISIEPAIKDREELLSQQRHARNSLKEALEKCGVTSLKAAEEHLTKRNKLLQDADLARQETELHAPATADYDAGAESLADYIEGLKTILAREISELETTELPTAHQAEDALQDAENNAREARESLSAARAALEGPEEEQGRIQTELGAVKTRHEDGEERLENLKNDLAVAEKQSSEGDLQDAVTVTETALVEQEKSVANLETKREGETLTQLDARISRLEKSIQDRREKRAELKEKIAGFQSHIEALEGAGMDEAIQQKSRESELVDEQVQRNEREVQILSLLLSTLRSAESDAKERYLSPVLNRLRPYLQLLFPGAEITIDENLHIVGMVREGGYEEEFHHLSIGTQEQIAVLVRLAFAEMLVEQGHPATVVLDDALVFSDDRRMDRMFDILNVVAERVQIIVLTCREQLFEGVGGHQLSLVSISEKDLESA